MSDGLGLSFSLQHLDRLNEITELTAEAEENGFQYLWVPEAWGRDAISTLAVLALRTKSIRLGTGIINIFSRSPALIAQSIASLDEISGGRAILGLGASGQRLIQHWHGLQFEDVLQRTREYVEVVRLVLRGDVVTYQGKLFRLTDFSLNFRPVRSEVPIYLAAIGPANIRLTAEIADGWLPIFASPRFLEGAGQWLAEGKESRNVRGTLRKAAYIPTLLGPEADNLLRRHIAYYVGNMGSYYFRLMVRSGFKSEAETIRSAWRGGYPRQAIGSVTHEMLHAMTLSGKRSEARSRLQAFRDSGIDEPILAIPAGASAQSIRATLEALGGG